MSKKLLFILFTILFSHMTLAKPPPLPDAVPADSVPHAPLKINAK